MKRLVLFLVLVVILAGCGTTPPRPPECSGPLVPINARASAS
jgi:hypothetical protein